MQLGILMNLAPRKLGSFEGWIAAMCAHARSAGHQVDVFGRAPAHPSFLARLEQLGCGFATIDSLEDSTYRAIRRLRGYDALHLNMFAPRSRIALMAYASYPARVMFVDHTSGLGPGSRRELPVVAMLKRAADSITLVRVDGVAGVSGYVSDRLTRRFRFARHKVRTIYNGVDLSRFTPASEVFDLPPEQAQAPHPSPGPAPAPASPVGIVTVAHLIPHKGVDHLVRAMALARSELRLTVVGDGPQLEPLRALARELGVAEKVTFAGLRNDVHALLAGCDVFVHPAVWEEAFGLTIAEAMAAGRAVVASRTGGIPELVEDGVSGLLVEPGDPGALARALDLLSARPALRQQLGASARSRAQQRFNLEQCAREHIRWCEGAVARM
ncbi:MAG TPA: glycosyltransferase family 4 protein [Myxococcaceae bacterium]|jgi:glycosyltransferase involved in cell wall biosynthesis